MNINNEYFKILGIDKTYSLDEVKNAYNIAISAWQVDDSAPKEYLEKSKQQLLLIEETYKKLSEIFENNLIYTNKIYMDFKVETKDVELTQFKIRYLWRFIYISLIFILLLILYWLYPLKEDFNNIQPLPDKQEDIIKEETKNNQNNFQKQKEKAIDNQNIDTEANHNTNQ